MNRLHVHDLLLRSQALKQAYDLLTMFLLYRASLALAHYIFIIAYAFTNYSIFLSHKPRNPMIH